MRLRLNTFTFRIKTTRDSRVESRSTGFSSIKFKLRIIAQDMHNVFESQKSKCFAVYTIKFHNTFLFHYAMKAERGNRG